MVHPRRLIDIIVEIGARAICPYRKPCSRSRKRGDIVVFGCPLANGQVSSVTSLCGPPSNYSFAKPDIGQEAGSKTGLAYACVTSRVAPMVVVADKSSRYTELALQYFERAEQADNPRLKAKLRKLRGST